MTGMFNVAVCLLRQLQLKDFSTNIEMMMVMEVPCGLEVVCVLSAAGSIQGVRVALQCEEDLVGLLAGVSCKKLSTDLGLAEVRSVLHTVNLNPDLPAGPVAPQTACARF